MATTAQDAGIVTLAELAKATGPDGKLLRIAEVMTKRSPFLQDVHFQQGNTTTGHIVGRRTALPSLTWRQVNEGVEPSKSLEDSVTEECGLLEGRSEIDAVLMQLNGGNEYRAKKDMAFIPAFSNEIESGFFYHSRKTAPKKFTGLTPRLDALSGLAVAQSQVVASQISASGDDQMSAWFVGWGPDKVYGIVPKGTQAGLQHVDMGMRDLEDASGNKYEGRVSIFRQWVGLCIEDYRYVVRVCNIDKSALVRTGKLLVQSLVDGYHQIQDPRQCNLVLYMGRYLFRFLHQQVLDNALSGNFVQASIEDGKPVMRFMGVPIRVSEVLHYAETIVS